MTCKDNLGGMFGNALIVWEFTAKQVQFKKLPPILLHTHRHMHTPTSSWVYYQQMLQVSFHFFLGKNKLSFGKLYHTTLRGFQYFKKTSGFPYQEDQKKIGKQKSRWKTSPSE